MVFDRLKIGVDLVIGFPGMVAREPTRFHRKERGFCGYKISGASLRLLSPFDEYERSTRCVFQLPIFKIILNHLFYSLFTRITRRRPVSKILDKDEILGEKKFWIRKNGSSSLSNLHLSHLNDLEVAKLYYSYIRV